MRSAIYYPHSSVRKQETLQSALLLWDRLIAIAPYSSYRPDYGNKRDLAEAWELIGKHQAPDHVEQMLAHRSLEETLEAGISPALRLGHNRPPKAYEVWPQKLSPKTWELLQDHNLTDRRPLANGDFPFVPEAGVMVMAKLADASGGDAFARITDYEEAFALLPDPHIQNPYQRAHLIALQVVDPGHFSFRDLIEFRKRELKERDGQDYTDMRHAYTDKINAHAVRLQKARTRRQREELDAAFKADMQRDLRDLAREITGNRISLVLKPVLVASVAGGLAAGIGLTYGAALAAMGAAAVGTTAADVGNKLAEIFEAGFTFSSKQREVMRKHPMAYMLEFSRR